MIGLLCDLSSVALDTVADPLSRLGHRDRWS
jgi:hypothetical protein